MTASTAIALFADINSRFFDGLTSTDRNIVLASATLRRYRTDATVTTQGNPAEHLYLLAKGRARYFFLTQSGQKLLLRWFLPGEIFGACALLSYPSPYLVSTETIEASIALVWDYITIRRLAVRYPRLFENALAIAAEYLTLYVSAHVALTSQGARQRLAEILLNLATTIGRRVATGFELEISNEELANAANITLFTASRLVAEWQRLGAIEKSRGKILVRNPELLVPRRAKSRGAML